MLLAFCISESNLHVTQVILKPALKGTCWYPILWQSACEIQLTTLFCGLIQHLATQLESSMKDETIKWPGRQMVWPKVRRLVRPMAWIVRPIFRSMAWILGPIVRPMAWILGINSSLTYEDQTPDTVRRFRCVISGDVCKFLHGQRLSKRPTMRSMMMIDALPPPCQNQSIANLIHEDHWWCYSTPVKINQLPITLPIWCCL